MKKVASAQAKRKPTAIEKLVEVDGDEAARAWLDEHRDEIAALPPEEMRSGLSDPELERLNKQSRDREREQYRNRAPRVAKSPEVARVPLPVEFMPMVEALHRLALDGVQAFADGGGNEGLPEMIAAAYSAAFGELPFQWASRLVLAIDALYSTPEPERASALALEPAELIRAHRPEWSFVVPVPGYVTRGVVQWLYRHYTPASKAGGGRLPMRSIALLLTHPESLADELDKDGGDRAASRHVRDWLGSHGEAEPVGWYRGPRPA